MHPRLLAAQDHEERALCELVARGAAPFEALCTMAALHNGITAPMMDLREGGVCAADKVFPHPQDVPTLLLCTLQRLNELFEQCQQPLDDLHVVVFSIFCVLETHPFANGNGRTALSFAQYLLMHRWRSSRPLLVLHKDAHREIGHMLRGLGRECDGQAASAIEAMTLQLADLLATTTLPALHAIAPIHTLAVLFATSMSTSSQSTTGLFAEVAP